MTHDEFDSQIAISLAGGLADEEMAAFEAHRAGCAACARALDEGEAFERAVTGALAPLRAPADLADRIVAAHDAARPARRWRVPGWVAKPALAAAAAGAMIAVGAWATRESDVTRNFTDDVRANMVAQSGIDKAVEELAGIEWAKDPSYMGEVDGRTIMTHDMDAGSGDSYRYADVGEAPATFRDTHFGAETAKDTEIARLKGDLTDLSAKFQQTLEHTEALNRNLAVLTGLQQELQSANAAIREQRNQAVAERQQAKAELPDGDYRFVGAGEVQKINDDLKIIHTSTMQIEVDAFDAAARRVAEIAAELEGYVSGESREKLPNGKVRGQITLRVPAGRFDRAMELLGPLGDVSNQNVAAQDVTKAYVDLQSRLKNAQTLEERLRKLIEEGKGEIKELLEVEKELAVVRERIELMTGELKYYDHQVVLSTLTLSIGERDIEQPAEYVETMAAVVELAAADVVLTYNGAREAVTGAGGQVLESKLNRADGGEAEGTIRARIPAEKFDATLAAIKALGVVENAVTDVRQSSAGAAPGAKLRQEAGIVEVTIRSPREVQRAGADLKIETADVAGAYARLRAQFPAGELRDARLARGVDGAQARVAASVPMAKFDAAVASAEALGEVKERTIARDEQALKTPAREVGRLNVLLVTPPKLIPEEEGFGATVERTGSQCVKGLLWSVEKLFVGAAYVIVWGLPVAAVGLFVRRLRRRAASPPAAA